MTFYGYKKSFNETLYDTKNKKKTKQYENRMILYRL